jgi:DNA repair photolyase
VCPADLRFVEVESKTITRRYGTVDPWFLGRYGCNLYRGCQHACAYCDGRAERYHVQGDFDRDIAVKVNAVELLSEELARPPEPGFVFVGGGVCDAWQPAERRYRLARGVLEIALERGLPVHALTKAALVERDLDLLGEIQGKSRAILSFSVQGLDEGLRERFEPGAAPIEERLRLLRLAKEQGLATGLMAMPVLPGLSDQPEAIDRLVGRAADVGVDFVLYGGLTLRPGTQKQHMLRAVEAADPSLLPGYRRVYRDPRPSGVPDLEYLRRVDDRFVDALSRRGLASRIPRGLFTGLMPVYSEVAVLLEHRDEAERRAGRPAPKFAGAGMAIQKWARTELGRRSRRKGFDHRVLEGEFRARAHDGTLGQLEGVPARALGVVRELLTTLPEVEPPGQMALL